jgi:hypothetical protein
MVGRRRAGSGDEAGLPGEVVDSGGVGAGGGGQVAVAGCGPARLARPVRRNRSMQPDEEQGVREVGGGDLVTEAVRNAFDEPRWGRRRKSYVIFPGVIDSAKVPWNCTRMGAGRGGRSRGEEAGRRTGPRGGRGRGDRPGAGRDAGSSSGDERSQVWRIAAWPSPGSWLSFWTSSRHRVAAKPAARKVGRLVSRLPMPKSIKTRVETVQSVTPKMPRSRCRAPKGCPSGELPRVSEKVQSSGCSTW